MERKEVLVKRNVRAHTYKLLSDCFYQPDLRLIERLKGLDELTGWPCAELSRYIPNMTGLGQLKIDFSKLFLGPYKLLAPPYGSLYLEHSRAIMDSSTIDVKKRYDEEGLDITLKEVPDHIALELEFMYLLIIREMQAIENSNDETAESYREKQSSFLQLHLGKWVAGFAHNVQMHAQTEFYKNLARITNAFIQEELHHLARV